MPSDELSIKTNMELKLAYWHMACLNNSVIGAYIGIVHRPIYRHFIVMDIDIVIHFYEVSRLPSVFRL